MHHERVPYWISLAWEKIKIHSTFPTEWVLLLYHWKVEKVAQRVKRLPAMRETWVQSLSQEDPLEKEKATHFSTLAWKIPWTKKPGSLQSMGSQRVRHDWLTSLSLSKLKTCKLNYYKSNRYKSNHYKYSTVYIVKLLENVHTCCCHLFSSLLNTLQSGFCSYH